MSVLFTLHIPTPKVRKTYAPGVKVVKDKKKYTRKAKHKKGEF